MRRKGSDSLGGSTSWATHITWGYIHNQRITGVAAAAAAILALMMLVPLAIFVLQPFQVMYYRVDPELYETLAMGKPAYGYVSVVGDARLGLKPVKEWHFGKLHIYKVRIASLDQLNKILSTPNVVSVYGEKTFRHPPLHFLSVEEYEEFRKVDIDNEFHRAYGPWCGRNVTVAIIDTGIDYTHPDFFDENNRSIVKVLVSMFYVWADSGEYVTWDLTENPNITELLEFDKQVWQEYGEPAFLDINGHGSHVAGIVAGRGWASNGKFRGVAPCVELVVVKAFNKDGVASMDACLEALEWIYNNTEKYGIKILSLSWGASFASDGNDPLSLAVDRLVEDKGVWVFVSAGNEGNLPTTITVPAVARRAFAVGAWDAYKDKLAPFSSLGPTIDMRMKPDLVASGVMVVSCKSQYVDFPDEYEVGQYYVALSGTSMAAPAAAAIAADFIEYFRYWHGRDPTVEDFIKWIKNNGRRINLIMEKDFVTGWGIPI
ncbi:MAG: S8 family serine peptidase, partial [Deltaproteobacteria bacterium]|nr:S8 family serine peptidase [Deltaproteobacteria bacterium]